VSVQWEPFVRRLKCPAKQTVSLEFIPFPFRNWQGRMPVGTYTGQCIRNKSR
jgi:hypothetical protein